jgi:hypothetical protein|eukprot:COSAG01_NODE_88_length_27337_cov_22.941699_17_plen_80_part_00
MEWLATEAIDAPLPPGTTEHQHHTSGCGGQTDDDAATAKQPAGTFFFNRETNRSSYEHPYDRLYRELYRCLTATAEAAD